MPAGDHRVTAGDRTVALNEGHIEKAGIGADPIAQVISDRHQLPTVITLQGIGEVSSENKRRRSVRQIGMG
jgi:hypothetical protein